MVIFGSTDYFHAMDAPRKQIKDMEVKEFGVSAKIGDVLQALKADINTGTKHVELVFMGTGKGNLTGMNTNPEMFDKVKRDEIRKLAKINDVTLSTHAAVQMTGASGFNPQQGFSDTLKQERLQEIKRTIDFAADTAGGGAVVVHTGEFPRTVKDTRFIIGKKDKEQEPLYLANKETGQILAIPRHPLHLPKWKQDKEGRYLDIDGKPLPLEKQHEDYAHRAVEYNEKGEIQWQVKKFDDFKKEIDAWNAKHGTDMHAEKKFAFLQSFQQIQAEKPRAYQFLQGSEQYKQEYDKLQKKIQVWKDLYEKTPKEKQDYLLHAFKSEFKELASEIDKKNKKPHEVLQEASERAREESIRLREGFIGFEKNVKELDRRFENIDSIEKIGVQRSADTFADAALYAYRLGKQKKLDKAVFVAPENMFAEYGYGGHPDELRELVQSSRKRMVEKLADLGVKGKEAAKIAEQHIKATFDVGHANTWAKYFEEDLKLSPEENKKKFDTWMLGEVKKLIDGGIIGNVHISDNFGYQDEHLNVGGGNAPIRDFVKLFRDPKYEGKLVVEWGAQGPEEQQEAGSLLAAWANLAGSPMYRVEGMSPKWSDIEMGGYFGTSSSPFHISGTYGAGLGKDWRLWSYSEAPIE